MAAKGRQEKIWKTCWKVWKIHKGGWRLIKYSWISGKAARKKSGKLVGKSGRSIKAGGG
jgi:hypothetical protein